MFDITLSKTVRFYLWTLLAIGTVVGAMIIYGWSSTNKVSRTVKSDWTEYSEQALKKAVLSDQLIKEVGYTGFIHNFKNYVLRRSDRYREAAAQNYKTALAILGDYRRLQLSDQEKDALRVIAEVLSDYSSKLTLIENLILQDATPDQIDQIVIVDDNPAKIALEILHNGWLKQHQRGSRALSEAVELVDKNTERLGITFVAIILVGALVLSLLWQNVKRRLIQEAEQTRRLEAARVGAEQANAAKSDFLASMSHELRTPMNAVLGYAQLLQLDPNKQLNERDREYIDHVIVAGHQMIRLVDDLLDLSAIEANQIRIEITTFSPLPAIREVQEELLVLTEDREISISLKMEDSAVDTQIESDQDRYKQVVRNLLSNAIKYSEPGGSIVVKAAITSDGYYRVSVSDTGLGIPNDKKSQIFNMFDRGDSKVTRNVEGVGIGLAVSKMLCDSLGGRIGFNSQEGVGSDFWFDVPLSKNSAPEANQHSSSKESASDANLSPRLQ